MVQQILAERRNNRDGFSMQQQQECYPSYDYASPSRPSWENGGWNSPGSNQWENQDDLFQELPPSRESFQETDLNFKERLLSMLETKSATEEKLVTMIGIMGESIQAIKADNTQMREEYATRIDSLEQTKMHNEQVIEEQVKKIESLEETVRKLESRLRNQQYEQTKQYESNLRQIKQINVEVPHLREQVNRVDSWLCHVQQQQVNHTQSGLMDDLPDSDDEQCDMISSGLGDKKGLPVNLKSGTITEVPHTRYEHTRDKHTWLPTFVKESLPTVPSTDTNCQIDSPITDIKELLVRFWEEFQRLKKPKPREKQERPSRFNFTDLPPPPPHSCPSQSGLGRFILLLWLLRIFCMRLPVRFNISTEKPMRLLIF